MRLSFSWLSDYLNDSKTIEEKAYKLNETLTEVDGIEEVKPHFEGVYIGKILTLEKHTNADKLRIAIVDIKTKQLRIVCGAPNIYEGMIVPVAIEGTALYDEAGDRFLITKTKIRGEESEGMLCSPRELGISKDHSGILDLSFDKSLKIGALLDPIFTDKVLKIENKAITHRPDCFSHEGVARELAAISNKAIKPLPFQTNNSDIIKLSDIDKDTRLFRNEVFNSTNDIKLKVDGYTRRYSTITIKGIKIKPSPAFIQARLIALGHHPINNVVDLTNYVMYSVGQPLHAFDADKTGYNFHIRTGLNGEKLKVLDGNTYELTPEDITISDGPNPLDIGGIIGGYDSGINDNTQNVVLVADNFDPSMLRRTSWRTGIRTDAVTIYEKNIDPNLTINGLIAFVNLYKELYPEDEIGVSTILDYYPEVFPEWKSVIVSHELINGSIGENIKIQKIEEILSVLGIILVKREGGILTLNVPSRRTDLNTKEDIIEEILRLYGYSNLPIRQYFYKLQEVKTYKGREEEVKALNFMANKGYIQIETYLFADLSLEEKLSLSIDPVKIKNPINIESNILKSSTIPELARVASRNLKIADSGKFFSFTRTFSLYEGKSREEKILANVYFDKKSSPSTLYYNIQKDIVDALLSLGINENDINFSVKESFKEQNLALSKSESAAILIKGKYSGYIGLSSSLLENVFDMDKRAVFTMLKFENIVDFSKKDYTLMPYSKFPSISFDISMYVNTNTYTQDIIEAIKSQNIKDLVDIKAIDTFQKENKAITIRLTFNNLTKTLEKAEVESSVENIQSILKKQFKDLQIR